MPNFLFIPTDWYPWICGLILLGMGLSYFERFMNRLAKDYRPCPHCKKSIHRRQKACHHCLTNL